MEENQKYVTGSLLVACLILWYVLGKALLVFAPLLGDLMIRFGIGGGFGANTPYAVVRFLAAIIAVITIILLRRDERVNGFLLEVVMELKKVTWSTPKETWASTIVVIVGIMIIAAVLGAFDMIWSWVSTFVLA